MLEPPETEHVFHAGRGSDGGGGGDGGDDTDSRTRALLVALNDDNHNLLVKTVRNEQWKTICKRLSEGEAGTGASVEKFSSSFTLPPRNGGGMSLFGPTHRSCCGLILDARKISHVPPRRSSMEIKKCRNFGTVQGCRRGDKCPFRHDSNGGEAAAAAARASAGPSPTPDLANLWCWPPGVYAKTEFNLDSDGQPTNRAVEQAACTLEELREYNRSRSFLESGKRVSIRGEASDPSNPAAARSSSSGDSGAATEFFIDGNGPTPTFATDVMPYNEVHCPVEAGAIVGIFSRTTQRQHLLFLLGLQRRLGKVLGSELGQDGATRPPLPVVIMTPLSGAAPFSLREQTALIKDYIKKSEPMRNAPAEPLDLCRMKLPSLAAILFHVKYGATDASVEAALDLEYRRGGFASLESIVHRGLAAAADIDNASAARTLIKLAAPYVLRHKTNKLKMKAPSCGATCTWSVGTCRDGTAAHVFCVECAEYLCSDCHSRHSVGRSMCHHTVEDASKPHPRFCNWSAGTCDEGTPASLYCKDCAQYLCAACFDVHSRGRSTRHHVVVDEDAGIDEASDTVSSAARKEAAPSRGGTADQATEEATTGKRSQDGDSEDTREDIDGYQNFPRNVSFSTISAVATAAASPDEEDELETPFPSLHAGDGSSSQALPSLLDLDLKSDQMLAIVGAYHTVVFVASGKTPQRIEIACNRLETWLTRADSITFRVSSWWQESEKRKRGDGELPLGRDRSGSGDGDSMPAMAAFIGNKAVTNRTAFLAQLKELRECARARGEYLLKLHEIVSKLNRPSLRLELLQYVLGLDQRYHREVLVRTCELALSLLATKQ